MKEKIAILGILFYLLTLTPVLSQSTFSIVFASDRDGDLEIYTMNPDGSNVRQLTSNSATDKNPVYSYNGNKIVFDSNRNGNSEIYIMNSDGSGQTRLTNHPNIDWDPAISPDGTKIVFTRSTTTNNGSDLWIMNSDGSGQTKILTGGLSIDIADPDFTPNGKIIFSMSAPSVKHDIYLINQDGSSLTRVVTSPYEDIFPHVSPDGSKMLFTSNRDGDFEIYSMNIDGTNLIQLTHNTANDMDAVFSPDGSKIIFVSDRDGNSEIYTMNSDGSNQIRLTFSSGKDGFVSTAVVYPTTTTTIRPTTTTILSSDNLDVGDLDVSPSSICRASDRTIKLSVPVKLVSGNDNTEITARFYIEDNDGDYTFIGRERKTLDIGERRTFSIDYDYDAYDLDVGNHDVKVVVENEDRETEYANLRVKNCREDKDIEVGFIYLNPEFPRLNDIVQGNVLITLNDAPSLPQTVDVEVRIDGRLVTTSDLRFYHIESKNYQFSFDADRYGEGRHTITVKATLDDLSDISSRTFTIGERANFPVSPQHCLIIKDFWSDQPLKEEQSNTLKARVRNCGLETEYSINTKLTALGKTFSDSILSLRPNEERDVSFVLRLDDTSILNAKVYVWNNYASDEIEREFSVLSGYPRVEAKPEYRVRQCSQQNITFDIINVGQLKDDFTVNITGEAGKWISGYPPVVLLDSGERTTIMVDVNVPCDARLGVHQFTISAQGSPKYAVTSSFVVSRKPFSLTGLFAGIDFGKWLPWIVALLLLLILLPLLFLLLCWLLKICKVRRKPERCMGPHGC